MAVHFVFLLLKHESAAPSAGPFFSCDVKRGTGVIPGLPMPFFPRACRENSSGVKAQKGATLLPGACNFGPTGFPMGKASLGALGSGIPGALPIPQLFLEQLCSQVKPCSHQNQCYRLASTDVSALLNYSSQPSPQRCHGKSF